MPSTRSCGRPRRWRSPPPGRARRRRRCARRAAAPSPPGVELGDLPAGEEAGAEPDRLVAGPLGEPHAGDAAREAEVVADHRARCRPGRRSPRPRRRPWRGPPRRRRPPPRARPDPRRRCTRSTTVVDVDVVGAPVDRGPRRRARLRGAIGAAVRRLDEREAARSPSNRATISRPTSVSGA